MTSWQLQITTRVDGRETVTERMGEVEIDGSSVKIGYAEESAFVIVTVEKEKALINRNGDYGLFLLFSEGERTDGSISISGSEGALSVKTDKVRCLIKEGGASILLLLEYTIDFGAELQKMQLRLLGNKRK